MPAIKISSVLKSIFYIALSMISSVSFAVDPQSITEILNGANRVFQTLGEQLSRSDEVLHIGQEEIPLPPGFKKYNPENSPEIKKWIDVAYRISFSAPTMRNTFSSHLQNPRDLVYNFGMSREEATIISGLPVVGPLRGDLNTQRLSSAQNDQQRFHIALEAAVIGALRAKFEFFVSANPHQLSFDSWSDEGNLTRIFVYPQGFNTGHLISVLVHEAAIKYDKKSDMHGWLLQNQYRGSTRLLGAVGDRDLNRAFRTLRAFRFESSVIAEIAGLYKIEMSQTQKDLAKPSEETCGRYLQKSLQAILQIPTRLSPRSQASQLWTPKNPSVSQEALSVVLEEGACLQLTEPFIGRQPRLNVGAGPRPNLTGGFD